MARRIVGALVLALAGLSGTGQAQTVKLPEGWRNLPNDEFAAAVRVLYEQDLVDRLSPADHDAVRAEGHKRFLLVNVGDPSLTYKTLEILHWLTRFNLPQEVVNRTESALVSRHDDWTGRPYAEMKAKIRMMLRLGFNEGVVVNEARRWVLAGGARDQVPAADLQHPLARQCFDDVRIVNGPFSVEWNGFLTPTATGKHVFSISPINVNANNPNAPVRFAMTVSVGGTVVLNSTPATAIVPAPGSPPVGWVSASGPISLTAGQPVALRVTVNADVTAGESSTLHAILSWQAPAGATAVVPPGVLTQTNPGKAGLLATYRWSSSGEAKTLSRVEPNIDASWAAFPMLLSQDLTLASGGADEMWNMQSSQMVLRDCLNSGVTHAFFKEPDGTSSGLTSDRRRAFQALVLQNPALLDTVTLKQAVEFYQSHRFGATETALDVFGTWAGRHADQICQMIPHPEFDQDNRWYAAVMARLTTMQSPNHVQRLRNEYLQAADGRCSLPVAYVLAASSLGQRKLGDWTMFLDNRLADTSLTGDLRVNWLIARAEAEEIRQLPRELDIELAVHTRSRALDGRGYLDQALRAAQSPAVKSRVAREIAARLVWAGEFQPARDLLTQTSQSLPSDQQALLTALRTQIDAWAAAQTQTREDQATASRQAYRATLRRRRDQAAARGDSAAVGRYNALMGAAGDK
jgi:hypothetical protein